MGLPQIVANAADVEPKLNCMVAFGLGPAIYKVDVRLGPDPRQARRIADQGTGEVLHVDSYLTARKGIHIHAWDDGIGLAVVYLLRVVSVNPERELAVTFERNGAPMTVKITPERKEESDGLGGKIQVGRLGIRSVNTPTSGTFKRYGPVEALVLGVKESVYIITSSLSSIGKMISGRENAAQLGGPLKIAAVAGKAASIGFDSLLNVAALVSLSVGLFNLFPIPPLDGGHLMFYAAEAIRGRPLSDNAKEIGFRMGFALILMLVVLVMWNDRLVVKGWMGG